MREVTKKYYIQETELCILLAFKGKQTLYGIDLNSAASMTREKLYHNLFAMQKKGMISRKDSFSDAFCIEEKLDCCMERIQTAARFLLLADADELVPEKYFYAAQEGAVMLEPVGQYDAGQQEGAFRLELITEAAMWKVIRENGIQMEPESAAVPDNILEEAQVCWLEDKDTILQRSAVQKLLQEYDVHTRSKKRQCIRFVCGLDTYLVCSDEGKGGERIWY